MRADNPQRSDRRPAPNPRPLIPDTRHLIPDPRPQYVAIGHITIDRSPSPDTWPLTPDTRPPTPGPRSRAGGSAAYAAMTASRLGLAAAIVTVAGEEIDWVDRLQGIELVRKSAPASTTFENLYRGGRRTQRILEVAEPIPAELVPLAWKAAPIVHLAPVVHEVGGTLPALFPSSLVGLTPQGLLRQWNERTGAVRQGRWAGDNRLLAGSQVVAFSEEDIAGDPDFLSLCLDRVPITLLTRGVRGATLFVEGQPTRFPAFPAAEVDPTGAGDVFAAAFLIEYHLCGDPYRSAAFACCAASLAVEHSGLEAIPDREAVEQRLDLYQRDWRLGTGDWS